MKGFWAARAMVEAPSGGDLVAPREDPCVPSAEQIRALLETRTRAVLMERVRIGLWLALASLVIFLLQDVIFFPENRVPLATLKALQISFVAGILAYLYSGGAPRNPVRFAISISAVLLTGAATAGVLRGTPNYTPMLFIAISAGTAIAFPWGMRVQAILVALCAVLLGWNDYAIDGSLSPTIAGPATIAMVTAGMISILVARGVEQFHWQIEEREAGLRLREQHFRALIENGRDLILVADAGGTVHYASPSAAAILGRAAETWSGKGLLEFVHPEDAALLRAAMADARAIPRSSRSVELRLSDAAGEWRVMDGILSNLLDDDAVRGWVFNARDVTDRHRMESELRANQSELTHVLRVGTMGEIASALAHEINQPLAAISNYASACARMLATSSTPASIDRGLRLIAEEALRAGRIVQTLRDLGRKRDAGLERVDLTTVVQRAAELMEPQARLHGISLRVELEEDLPRVDADPIQIEQVILNLVLNGIEAMQSSGEKNLEIATRRRGERVEVSVRDSGSGLEAEHAEQVFEAFFTTKPTGLGMGLAISRRIIQGHGGALWGAANADGPGACFTFSLPLPSSAGATEDPSGSSREAVPLATATRVATADRP